VAIFNPATMTQKATITIPGAQHIDGIAVDAPANRVWLTDEVVQAVFVLQGACANGTGACIP
jgi:DNA-binding beta-propeller fold protein YncE